MNTLVLAARRSCATKLETHAHGATSNALLFEGSSPVCFVCRSMNRQHCPVFRPHTRRIRIPITRVTLSSACLLRRRKKAKTTEKKTRKVFQERQSSPALLPAPRSPLSRSIPNIGAFNSITSTFCYNPQPAIKYLVHRVCMRMYVFFGTSTCLTRQWEASLPKEGTLARIIPCPARRSSRYSNRRELWSVCAGVPVTETIFAIGIS